jgi:hypothetical protein
MPHKEGVGCVECVGLVRGSFIWEDWVVLDCGYAAPGVGRFVGAVVVG